MDYLTDVDVERLKKFWPQLEGFSPDQDFAGGLLGELFDDRGKSLKDSISLLSGSIHKRKSLAATKTEMVSKRLDQIQVAL